MSRGQAQVLSQRDIAQGYMELRFGPVDSTEPKPGQFFTLKPSQMPVPLLRRPFAYSDWHGDEAAFIYQIRGKGTQDFAQLEPGDLLDWMGPLGNGFPDPPEDHRPILVAGGIGLGPLWFYAHHLVQSGYNPLLIIGARGRDLVPRMTAAPGVEVRITTDDGSHGLHGTALDALADSDIADGVFYACGPHPMMKALHDLALEARRPCWVSLEEMMACGVGACQGCAVPKESDGAAYDRACVEGPVFPSREVAWT